MSDTRVEALADFIRILHRLGVMQPRGEVPDDVLNRVADGEIAAERDLAAVIDAPPHVYTKFLIARDQWRKARCTADQLFPGVDLDKRVAQAASPPPSPDCGYSMNVCPHTTASRKGNHNGVFWITTRPAWF